MKVKVVNRREAGAGITPSQGDNIFAQVSEVAAPRGIPALAVEHTSAQILRPEAFSADALERVSRTSPGHHKGIACLASSATVVTQMGAKPVSELQVGDMLLTRDNGFQPILWVKPVHGDDAIPMAVEINASQLQKGAPDDVVRLSGRQGVLLIDASLEEQFGSREVLVRAGDLLHLNGVSEVESLDVAYAVLMPRHEVIHVNGVWMESLVPDGEACKHFSAEDKAKLKELLPNLQTLPIERSYPAARNVLTSAFARQIRR